jgi:hypothetical protein
VSERDDEVMERQSPFALLYCWLGLHGPDWFGNKPHNRSLRVEPFVRECGHCGARWHGREVVRNNLRTLGGWEKVKP